MTKHMETEHLFPTTKVLDYLCRNNYDEIAFIDLKQNTISLRQFHNGQGDATTDARLDYDSFREKRAADCLSDEVRQYFLAHSATDYLLEDLRHNETSTFQVYQFAGKAERRLKRYRYRYFDAEKNIIFSVMEDITTISEHDLLTGGLNRQGLIHNVRRIVINSSDAEQFALLFFNIKDFKAINELLGVDGGDNVLRYFNKRLVESSMHPYVVSRIEADHFVCLIRQEDLDYDELARLCQINLSEANKKYNGYARCGIYLIEDKFMSLNQMCDRAKLAKDFIRDEFVKPYAVFNHTMQEKYIDQTEALSDLNRALDNHEFEVYYQPVFDTFSEKIVSAEALIRWNHPQKGFISPGVFIPAFEKGGHISKLDLYVALDVLHFISERLKAGKPVVPVSINLSWMDFYDENIMNTILDVLRGNAELCNYIRFEITETSYAIMADNNKNLLDTFQNLGAKILLDDFGSGYSSFSTIQNYDFDIIKLDMGFVQKIEKNEKTESIIHSIIDMAHHMNAAVIAEGAETAEQVTFLVHNDCDYIQGFYFSRPLPVQEFVTLLEEKS